MRKLYYYSNVNGGGRKVNYDNFQGRKENPKQTNCKKCYGWQVWHYPMELQDLSYV